MIVKDKVEEFKPYLPLLQGLRNPGMRDRHWQKLSEELGFELKPSVGSDFRPLWESVYVAESSSFLLLVNW